MAEYIHPSVDIGSIERELTLLWKEADEGDAHSPVIRACALNLILAGGDDAVTSKVLDDLSTDHPARTFLVSIGAQPDRPVEAWVAARCSIPLPGEKQVCSEQIHLRGDETAGERIASIVTSLLVPDVPTVIWHRSETGIPQELFRQFHQLCDFAIMDSAGVDDVKRSFSLLDGEARKHFADMAWERTDAWRRLFAEVFDSPGAGNEPGALTRMSIQYSHDPESGRSGLASAMFLVGWISYSLEMEKGREFRTADQRRFEGSLMMKGRAVHTIIHPAVSTHTGPLHEVILGFPDSSYALTVNHSGNCFEFTRENNRGDREVRRIPVGENTDVDLLSQLLVDLDSDEMYRASLNLLRKQIQPSA